MKKKYRRITMRKIKEIVRLSMELKLGIRSIARACNISTSTVHIYVEKLKRLNITYEQISSMDEEKLYILLFHKEEKVTKPIPDFTYLVGEMKKKGVTLQLLYEEYKRDHPDGYERSQFYNLYCKWVRSVDPIMRINHKAGEKMFVDFSGDKPCYKEPVTGNIIEAELFVSVLGASSYTFACAVKNQRVENFIMCNIKALEYYGGCPEYIVPDNIKSGVTNACYYDPEINRTFAEMAEHYHIAVIPTRVARPRDKAKVENGVLNVQRRILAVLRNKEFFSLRELNEAILEEVEKFNRRPMSIIAKSRYDLFIEIEKPFLKPLPIERFIIYNWKKAKVHIDYHVDVEKTYYSVPYTLIGEYVDIRYNGTIVEIYHKGKRITSHMRIYNIGAFVTDNLHMPHGHRRYLEWTPERIKRWGEKTGPNTKMLIENIMESKKYLEHGFRSSLGVIRLSKIYSPERVENACKRALEIGAYNYRSIKSILEKGLDKVTYFVSEKEKRIGMHTNIRGNHYYKEDEHDTSST